VLSGRHAGPSQCVVAYKPGSPLVAGERPGLPPATAASGTTGARRPGVHLRSLALSANHCITRASPAPRRFVRGQAMAFMSAATRAKRRRLGCGWLPCGAAHLAVAGNQPPPPETSAVAQSLSPLSACRVESPLDALTAWGSQAAASGGRSLGVPGGSMSDSSAEPNPIAARRSCPCNSRPSVVSI
jgi:hypothetical protein